MTQPPPQEPGERPATPPLRDGPGSDQPVGRAAILGRRSGPDSQDEQSGTSWQRPEDEPRRRSHRLLAAVVVSGVCLLGFVAAGVGAMTYSAGGRTGDPSSADAPAVETPPATSSDPATSSAGDRAPTSYSAQLEPLTGDPYARPVPSLADNPINVPGNGAVDTRCPLPRFSTDFAAQDAFYQAAVPCLMRMWAPSLRAAGLPVNLPRVVTVAQQVDTPCGSREWDETAMYCAGDNTIYMTARYYAEKENRSEGGAFLGQFAHEFGHSVQAMAGINRAYNDATAATGGKSPAGLELTRRSELQATCFEGMALASLQNGGVSNELIFSALADSRARGDEYNPQPDHGHVATNTEWIDRGFGTNRVTECNTWAAPPSDVD